MILCSAMRNPEIDSYFVIQFNINIFRHSLMSMRILVLMDSSTKVAKLNFYKYLTSFHVVGNLTDPVVKECVDTAMDHLQTFMKTYVINN